MLGEREHTFFDVFTGIPRKKATANHFFCIKYGYDALNRITAATSDASGNYNLSGITYDKNGNIETLNRNGWQNSTTFTDMDKLVYSYDSGNKLTKVLDNGNDNYGFKDGTNTNDDFEYDENGNLVVDRNKGITNITYNHLNLPVSVTLSGGTINYTYDAAGNKLRKIANSTTTDYAGNYKYVNGTLEFFNHAEGYVQKDGSSFSYVYQYKDHLDNVRLSYADSNGDGVITPSTEIIEESNYYPFGLKQKGYNEVYNPIGNSLAQKWGYNGKELNDDLVGGKNLNWHDFGARNYDAALGRWMNVDPLAEKMRRHSPYNYAFDNPVYFIDPDGMAPMGHDWIDNGDGTYTAEKGDSASSLHTQHLNKLGYSFEQVDALVQNQHGKNTVNPIDNIEDSNIVEGDVVDIIPAEDRAFVKAHNEGAVNELESEITDNENAIANTERKADSLTQVAEKVQQEYDNSLKLNLHKADFPDEPSAGIAFGTTIVQYRRELKVKKTKNQVKKLKNTADSLKKVNSSKRREIFNRGFIPKTSKKEEFK